MVGRSRPHHHRGMNDHTAIPTVDSAIDSTASDDALRVESESRHAAATWMAATGAFLLVAAAAVFVAVRWHEIPEFLKLALLGALSGGAIVAGRALRATLPACAKVLTHLGVALIPVVGAAIALRLDVEWPVMVLVDSLLAVAVFATFARLERSIVLEWATDAAVVASALGLAGVAGVPAGVTLGVTALALVATRRHDAHATALAGAAAVLPLVSAALIPFVRLASVTDTLLVTNVDARWGIGAGLMSATVFGWLARRQQRRALLIGSGVALSSYGIALLVQLQPTTSAYLVSAASGLVLLELAALVTTRDSFFAPLTRAVAATAEWVVLPVAGLVALRVLASDEPLRFVIDNRWVVVAASSLAATLALSAMGVVLGRVRMGNRTAELICTAAAPLYAIAAVACIARLSDRPWLTAGAAFAVALVALLPRRAALALWAIPAVAWMPHVTLEARTIAAASVSIFLLVVVAVHRGRGAASGLNASAAVVLGLAPLFVFDLMYTTVGYVVFASAAAWSIGVMNTAIGWLLRSAPVAVAIVAVSTLAGFGHTVDALVVSATLGLVAAFDVWIRHNAWWAIVPGVAIAVCALLALRLTPLDAASTGLALVAGATLSALVSRVHHAGVRIGAIAAACAMAWVGFGLSSFEAEAAATAWLIAGAGMIGLGVLYRVGALVPVGVGTSLVGGLALLALRHVTIVETYVSPVAIALFALGVWGRRSGKVTSSWAAYGPAFALVLSASIIERIAGGGGWHAVYAGIVAVGAVAFGAYRRLAAPLFLGTAAVVVITIRETLDVTAGVPTWGWLALGGVVLLGGGIALERTNTSPVDAGRRLVDVVSERYG